MTKPNTPKVKAEPASTTSSVKESPNTPQVKEQPHVPKIKNSESLKGKLKSIEDVRNKINELSNKAETLSNSLKESKLTHIQKQNIGQPLQKITRCHLPTDQIDVALRHILVIEAAFKSIKASIALIEKPYSAGKTLISSLYKFAATDLQGSKTALKTLANPMQQVFDATRGKLGSFQEKIEAGMPPELKRFLNAFPGVKIILYRLLGFKLPKQANALRPSLSQNSIKKITSTAYSEDAIKNLGRTTKFVYFGNKSVKNNRCLPFSPDSNDAPEQLKTIHNFVLRPGNKVAFMHDEASSKTGLMYSTLLNMITGHKNVKDKLKVSYDDFLKNCKDLKLKPNDKPLNFTSEKFKKILSKIPHLDIQVSPKAQKLASPTKVATKVKTPADPVKAVAKAPANNKTQKVTPPAKVPVSTAKPQGNTNSQGK